jgi:hypothetical protein
MAFSLSFLSISNVPLVRLEMLEREAAEEARKGAENPV